VLPGESAQVDARLLDELRNRSDPSLGDCRDRAELARATVGGAQAAPRLRDRPSAVPPKSAQTSAAKVAASGPLARLAAFRRC
jgi:hypothetical protein